MITRVRFYISLKINRDMGPGFLHQIEDHIKFFEHHMTEPFSPYNSMVTHTVEWGADLRDTIHFQWSIDLDHAKGLFHQPEDHIQFLQDRAVTPLARYNPEIDIETYFLVDRNDVVDHRDVLRINDKDGEYIDYRTEPLDDKGIYDEVFLLAGRWFWRSSKTLVMPIEGPEPTIFWQPWKPDFQSEKHLRSARSYSEKQKNLQKMTA